MFSKNSELYAAKQGSPRGPPSGAAAAANDEPPASKGENATIAVKVIDERGDEMMVVRKLEPKVMNA